MDKMFRLRLAERGHHYRKGEAGKPHRDYFCLGRKTGQLAGRTFECHPMRARTIKMHQESIAFFAAKDFLPLSLQ